MAKFATYTALVSHDDQPEQLEKLLRKGSRTGVIGVEAIHVDGPMPEKLEKRVGLMVQHMPTQHGLQSAYIDGTSIIMEFDTYQRVSPSRVSLVTEQAIKELERSGNSSSHSRRGRKEGYYNLHPSRR